MKVQFYGAARTVTGSCHILRIKDKLILLDLGLYQGNGAIEKENEYFPFDADEVDYVILSHAHIDHSGRIPLLCKRGFKGQVICTDATKDLCSVMLPDSGYIQEAEAEWKNRKRIRQGLKVIEPLYTSKDAIESLIFFKEYPYDNVIKLFDGLEIVFRDAGHLLGSAMVELIVKEDDKEIRLVYSGDIGNKGLPILKDPSKIKYADYVIMETTYGDRFHTKMVEDMKSLAYIIKDTLKRGGNVIIPSFAVGRTQEVLYMLNKYVENNELKNCTVYVDSPLATEATSIFKRHEKYYDEEAKKYLESGDNPLEFKGLVFTKSQQDSYQLNKIQSGAVIISASGMCEAGRIKHHLKHNLWRKECSIVFVGYQAEGTLGRLIVDGAKKVRIFGEEIAVNAEIYNLHGLSGHADRNGLYEWITGFVKKPKKVFLVHGDAESMFSFKELIENENIDSEIVASNQVIEIEEGYEIKLSKKDKLLEIIKNMDVDNMSKDEIIKLVEREI
ncbi:MBL fold metallo-hydrolase RNA specificity domain-containing protein [Clostridium peptidivorans]|uniref:MBL fold metallo-hydrolase RNA specificity domain-containing protein n=1 Tax=Clostridium peptidivorans TaxID=100174 RepID=UPI000BE3377D|nr:MBL fold metallo-hydrolase [Clostridium peptidivorans]